MMVYLALIFSFFLEIAISNIVPINNLFIPLFLLTALCIIYPYFNNKKNNFLFVATIFGLLYDISFTDSMFLNTLSFLACGYLIQKGYSYINSNIISCNVLNILIIIIYRTINYFLLVILGYLNINLLYLLKGIYSSLILNILYGIMFYIITFQIYKIFKSNK